MYCNYALRPRLCAGCNGKAISFLIYIFLFSIQSSENNFFAQFEKMKFEGSDDTSKINNETIINKTTNEIETKQMHIQFEAPAFTRISFSPFNQVDLCVCD